MNRQIATVLLALGVVTYGPVRDVRAAPSFTLKNAVPDGVYIYVHSTANPEREAIDRRWNEIWQAVCDARIQDDVREMVLALIKEPQARESFQAVWKRVTELSEGVQWKKLAAREFVYTARMSTPMPEYLFLMRGDEAAAEKNLTGLRNVLRELADLSEGTLTLTETRIYDVTVAILTIPGAPFQVQLARRGDVIAVGLTQNLLGESLALLTGSEQGARLVDTPRFKAALADLPRPEDSVMFLDVSQMFGGIRGILDFARAQSGGDEAAANLEILRKAIARLDIFEFVASVELTDGSRTITHEVTRLKQGGVDTPLGRVVAGQKPFAAFDRYIPKEATAFEVSSGIDLQAAYELVINFIAKEIPWGEDALKRWEAFQEQIGFHVKQDLLSWLGGESVQVTLPATTPTPFSQEDWVLFVRLRDADKARQKINAWVRQLEALLKQHDQPLAIVDVPVDGADGFKSITHPLIAMFFRPVYGVHEDQLILASSGPAIARCLATAEGRHPSVRANERVRREGLLPEGKAHSVSFTDRRRLGQQIASVLGMAGMGLNMVSAFNEEPEAKAILKGLGTIITKLSPIASRVNFLSSSASVTTFDGQAWHTKKVTTYRLDGP